MQVAKLSKITGNSACVDCGKTNPEWISLNLGVLMCLECSGVHRAMGVHITKVRSLTLDTLDDHLLNVHIFICLLIIIVPFCYG